jgi:hypothetical protein
MPGVATAAAVNPSVATTAAVEGHRRLFAAHQGDTDNRDQDRDAQN